MKTHKFRISTIAGSAALFSILTGNAHATSFPTRDMLISASHWTARYDSPSVAERTVVIYIDDQPRLCVCPAEIYPVGTAQGYDLAKIDGVAPASNLPTSTATEISNTVTPVPDHGFTAAFVGFALMGLAFVRKRLAV
ncbi:MAG: hypothetical protein QM715_01640 [Nibricoccus sp.]